MRSIKRIIAMTILVIITSISVMPVTIFAATDEKTADSKIELSVEQSLNEKEVIYTVRIPEKTEIAALQLEVSYDVTALKYQAVKTHSLYESGIGRINDKENGKITCAFISLMPLEDGGTFVEFSFTALKQMQVSSKMISFAFKELAKANGKTIDHHVRYIGFYEPPADQKENDTSVSQPSQGDDVVEGENGKESDTSISRPSQGDDVVEGENGKENDTSVSQPSQGENIAVGDTNKESDTPANQPSQGEDIAEGEPNNENDHDNILNEEAAVSDGIGQDEMTAGSSSSEKSDNDLSSKEQPETNIFDEEILQKEPTEKEESIKNSDVDGKKQEEQNNLWRLWIALGTLLIVAVVSIYFIKQTKERTK